VLDEPTNHLDLWARDRLERSLNAYEGTLLFVSHDRYFLNRVADHLLVVERDRFRVIEGNYDAYLHLVRAGLAGDSIPAAEATNDGQNGDRLLNERVTAERQQPRRKRRFPYRKVADLEKEIHDREAAIEEINAALINPDVLRNGDRVRTLKSDLAAHQEAITQLYEHWEEAAELNG
jgi:ATP-binding cassette subfamily F protein 3